MGFITRLEKFECAVGINDLQQEHHDEDAPSILCPNDEQWLQACAEIYETVPEEYGLLVQADVHQITTLPEGEEWEPKPLTKRFLDLAQLRIYQCPRTLALPEAHCRLLTEPMEEPGDYYRWDWWECMECALAAPTYVYVPLMRGNFQRGVGKRCDPCACGGQIGVRKPATQAPCHYSVGSPYREAWGQEGARLRQKAEENRK